MVSLTVTPRTRRAECQIPSDAVLGNDPSYVPLPRFDSFFYLDRKDDAVIGTAVPAMSLCFLHCAQPP